MILKLNVDGTITITPQAVPEDSRNIKLEYILPKGLNHMQPVLYWGKEIFEGNNIRINKDIKELHNVLFKVLLKDGHEVFKVYRLKENNPQVYVGFNIQYVRPDILDYVAKLEEENKVLKERGDIV